jgi:CRP-like cAMP-binding protein
MRSLGECDVTLSRCDVTQMLGFRTGRRRNSAKVPDESGDVARLFFDSFSKRVTNSEENMRNLVEEIEKLKSFSDQGRISDLVLLERLQRSEQLIKNSLDSIRRSLDEALTWMRQSPIEQGGQSQVPSQTVVERLDEPKSVVASHILSPTGELGSLQSITTPTELQVLNLLASEGPKSAPEIGVTVGRSREHTARLMKRLYEEGYVRRDQTRIPFRYSIVEKIRLTNKAEVRNGEKEEISVPQT